MTSRRCDSSSGGRRSIMRMTWRTMRSTMRSRVLRRQRLAQCESRCRGSRATSCAGSSMRVMPWSLSSTIRRPPTAIAMVARISPFSIQASLVVPPPISTLSTVVAVAVRHRDGAGAVRRHLAFHVMAGGGADEGSGHFREQLGDGARVVPLDRLAGEDHGAGIDVVGIDLREVVAAAEELGEVVGVDGVVGQVGRQLDRRLPHAPAA